MPDGQLTMKNVFALMISLVFMNVCSGQFDKQITFRATVNFNVVLGGLATNDAGAGLELNASFFSRKKLQLVVEGSGDLFIGDKLMVVDIADGRPTKNAAVYSFKAGPQYFITKNIAVAATYGPAWHVLRDFDFTLDLGSKYSINAFWGKRRSFVTRLFFMHIATESQNIQYLGIAAGLRF